MSRRLPRVVVATAAAAPLLVVAGNIGARDRRPPQPATPHGVVAVGDASEVAAAFIVAVLHVDGAHPHGDVDRLRRLCTPQLLDQLRTAAPLPTSAVDAGARQRGSVASVAARVEDGRAVVLVTATVVDAGPARASTRTAVAYSLTLRRFGAPWRVVGAAT